MVATNATPAPGKATDRATALPREDTFETESYRSPPPDTFETESYRSPPPESSWSVVGTRATTINRFKYPQDCYSLLCIYGPFDGRFAKPFSGEKQRRFFLFGLLPFIFQMSLILLLLVSVLDAKRGGSMADVDNSDSGKNGIMGIIASVVPSNAVWSTRCTQFVSLLAYVVFPESSLLDAVRSVQLFPRSSDARDGDTIGCMRFSCLLRGIQGTLAVMATMILIVSSKTSVDIILNFTAVNFISNLDDYAFQLAMSGEFGPALKAETERIADTDLPPCLSQACNKRGHFMIVLGLLSSILFGVIIFVIACQEIDSVWTTKILRVQFRKGTGLNQYSGCFEINDSSRFSQRRTYDSLPGVAKSSFGYCSDINQWILFKNNEEDTINPCDAATIEDSELMRSSTTDTFDVSSSFDALWVSASNTPLDLYFFDGDNETEIEEHCSSALGDGICDPFFNNFGYDFDGGDCCAATCTASNCGQENATSVFGSPNSDCKFGFPHCKNPEMVGITIHFNDISSSRDPEFAEYDPDWKSTVDNLIPETEWRAETPEDPFFALDCDSKNVLTVYIVEAMVGNSETVMVEDGANCTLIIRNTTTSSTPDLAIDDPILFINYTIFHERGIENEKIEILSQSSSEKRRANFKRIPECYFKKLRNDIEVRSLYTASGPSNKAIDWLLEEGNTKNSQCEEDEFIERYALANMMFAMNETAQYISTERNCAWPIIICAMGQVYSIKLKDAGLRGEIPSEIHLLQSLKALYLSRNVFSSIPTEIRTMRSLQYLFLDDNQITLIPTEIGTMTSLEKLDLRNNQISFLPTEIGLMTNLQELKLGGNPIAFLPTEIGLMTSLKVLDLDKCTGYDCIFEGDKLFSSLPTEIELLTNLLNFDLVVDHIYRKDIRTDLVDSQDQISSLPTDNGLLSTITFKSTILV